jgi:ribosomal protein L18E
LYIRIPKYGLKKSRRRHDEVNIGKVAYFIKKGWLDPQETITIKKLYDAGIIRKPKWGLKLLAGVRL